MADMDRDEVMELYHSLRQTWAQRNGEYDIARQRYNGIHWDLVTNPEPANRYSLTANYLKPIVDKSVQSLVGRIPGVQVVPNATDEVARRHAESLEGVLYGTWDANDVETCFFKTAWDSFTLRRGLIYIWWDPKAKLARFKNATPDHYYPEYDGDNVWRVVYSSRRSTTRLKDQYPDLAEDIVSDSEIDFGVTAADDLARYSAKDQTTIIDVFDCEGGYTRVMGNAVINKTDLNPFKSIPFIEFPCFPVGGIAEPQNLIDQLVELNQYLDQLISQKADIISRYSNPTILDFQSGQSPEDIRRAVAAQGAVIPVRRDGDIRLLNWQGTVPAIDEQITLVQDLLFDLSGKPRSSFGQPQRNQSGIATNLSLSPTLQSNEGFESVWSMGLTKLNEFLLMLWETNMAGDQIEFRGLYETPTGGSHIYDVSITGKDIGGWYKNRIKWPSATRTDDPVYVQNHLQQLQAQPFPALSLYTYLEEMGVEDVEAEIDRIAAQLEDPRFHPDRMTAAVGAMSQLQGQQMPPPPGSADMQPGAPQLPPGGPPGAALAAQHSLRAAGNPDQNILAAIRSGGH